MEGAGRVRAERVEVQRSREQILAAAERHFARNEPDLSMSELARLAGVGNATLYRRFASVDDVVRALYDRHTVEQQRVIDDMVSQDTGWDGVVALVTGLALLTLSRPAVPRVIRRMAELDPDIRHGADWDASLREVTRRAQDEGMLRPDVEANDISLAAFGLGDYGYLPDVARQRIVARQIVVFLDGLRADGERTPLPGEAVATDEIQAYLREPRA
ncbi:TetR/AcrR family transcriptional regulator [Microbacterium sulfonylureivorans]|uniref:TetR/AcrR family transcriptional regulator n=1 Tax=Microbacterium sulfonylureivorans TaxID=2486854 RepID=UPI0013E04C2E|nr:TetR/AcrR family transcriptional regulator [Microbacterium sulfonylureivorans]